MGLSEDFVVCGTQSPPLNLQRRPLYRLHPQVAIGLNGAEHLKGPQQNEVGPSRFVGSGAFPKPATHLEDP